MGVVVTHSSGYSSSTNTGINDSSFHYYGGAVIPDPFFHMGTDTIVSYINASGSNTVVGTILTISINNTPDHRTMDIVITNVQNGGFIYLGNNEEIYTYPDVPCIVKGTQILTTN